MVTGRVPRRVNNMEGLIEQKYILEMEAQNRNRFHLTIGECIYIYFFCFVLFFFPQTDLQLMQLNQLLEFCSPDFRGCLFNNAKELLGHSRIWV